MGLRKSQTCVLNMPMNEGQGDPHDSSRCGNNGINYGADWVSGDYGLGMEFVAANNDYVNCGKDKSLVLGTGNFGISMMFKSNENVAKNGIFQIRSWYSVYVNLHTHTGNFRMYIRDENYNVAISTTNICDNVWHYIVGSRDDDFLHLYVDGVDIKTVASNNIDLGNSLSYGCYIGYISEYGGVYSTQIINQLRVEKEAPTSAEVLANWNVIKARYGL